MKSSVIADTSGIISLASVTDSNHTAAKKISSYIKENNYSLVVPGEVFTETVNALGKKAGHAKAIGTADEILNAEELVINDTTPKIRERALLNFKTQPESVSFTDCLVMATADEYKTNYIFGFDETFRKNGYMRVGVDKKGK